MKFGVHLGTRGAAGSRDGLLAIARHAEACGLDYLGFSDHIVIAREVNSPYPYTADQKWFAHDTGFCLEQLSVLSFVAAVTERIRLLTSVMVIPYREPILANKLITTADILSNGRVTVGLGAGWMAEEMALLGSPPYAARGRVAQEYVEAFKALWTEDEPRYQGEFVSFDGLYAEPKSVQRPHPPLWMGGEAPAAKRRAGELGDGWYPVINNPIAPLGRVADYRAGLDDARRAAERVGRDPAKLDTALLAIGYQAAPARERRAFTGSIDAIRDDVGAYHRAGLENLIIGFESDNISACCDRISAFATDVVAQFQDHPPIRCPTRRRGT